MDIFLITICVVIGVIGGVVGTLIAVLKLNIGDLRVDQSDPYEEPYLFLELSKPVNAFRDKAYVLLRVNNSNYISHE